IGEVIGPKGKMINQIQEETGADITIEDDGTVYIGAVDGPSAEAARNMVNAIANPQMPEVGERFVGTVVKTTTFGAFVSLSPGKDGLLHISQVRKMAGGQRIESVEDVLPVGTKVEVELAEVDARGKLSLWAVIDGEAGAADAPQRDRGERGERGGRDGGDRGDRGGDRGGRDGGDRGDRGGRERRDDDRPRGERRQRTRTRRQDGEEGQVSEVDAFDAPAQTDDGHAGDDE
ncbi:MAG: S1 RNA-binding domain-containing protein, partial [bacterium]|nr:S1 RNA-binding domain-containing protein [bacterium]